MPIAIKELTVAGAGGGVDLFLHVQTKRAGKIKGESISPGHADDIVLSGWAWGLNAGLAVGSTVSDTRRSYTALTVHKSIDRATTGLMSALATNDEVKEAKLSMRRAGGEQEAYFVVTLKKARIASLQHQAAPDGTTLETVGLTFIEVEVEYHPQQGTGLRSGSTTFTDQIHPGE
jgi:type VI secretion system secreted protein Hcp